MANKYFGNFGEHKDLVTNFFDRVWDNEARQYKEPVVPEDFPTDEQILLAGYATPSYEGYAIVLFERDGKVYEVNGGHCSCYGLEGQWTPEETSWAALAARKISKYEDWPAEFYTAWDALIEAHGLTPNREGR